MFSKGTRAATLAVVLVLISPCWRAFLFADGAYTFVVVDRDSDLVTLEGNANCSPGTIVLFESAEGSVFVVIRRRLASSKYEASVRRDLSEKKAIEELKPGRTGTTATLLHSWNEESHDSPLDYWLHLKNWYVYGSSEWLTLENGKDLRDNKMPHNMPFLLSARQPTSEGYICLLSPEDNGRSIVLYPNTRPGSRPDVVIIRGSSENNLTYDARGTSGPGEPVKPAMLNIGLRADKAGPTHFVLVLSRESRPLSDFLPATYSGTFVDWEGNSIQPSEIGPGYLRRGAETRKTPGVDYLAGDEWGISQLTIDVAPQ